MNDDFAEIRHVEDEGDPLAGELSWTPASSGRPIWVRYGVVAVGLFVFVVVIIGAVFSNGDASDWQWNVGAEAPILLRSGHVSVWTGTELVVWGGSRTTEPGITEPLADGAAYDPASDTWRMLAPSPLAGRSGAGVVWTGAEILVLATQSGGVLPTRDGAAYDPATDTWRVLPEFDHTLGWSVLRTVDGTGYLRTRIRSVDQWLRIDNETGALLAVDTEEVPDSDPANDLVRSGGGEPIQGMDVDRAFVNPVWTGSVVLEATGGWDPQGEVRDGLRWRAIDPSNGTIVEIDPPPERHVRIFAQGAWTDHGWIIWGGLDCRPNRPSELCTSDGPTSPLILEPPT